MINLYQKTTLLENKNSCKTYEFNLNMLSSLDAKEVSWGHLVIIQKEKTISCKYFGRKKIDFVSQNMAKLP